MKTVLFVIVYLPLLTYAQVTPYGNGGNMSSADSGRVFLTPSQALHFFQLKGIYLIPSDSVSIRNYSNALYQASGVYLTQADSTSLRDYSNQLYQPQSIYLIPADSTSMRNYSAILYQAKGIYLIPSDTTVGRLYSNSLYQGKGNYLVPTDSTTSRTWSSILYKAKNDTVRGNLAAFTTYAQVKNDSVFLYNLIPSVTGLLPWADTIRGAPINVATWAKTRDDSVLFTNTFRAKSDTIRGILTSLPTYAQLKSDSVYFVTSGTQLINSSTDTVQITVSGMTVSGLAEAWYAGAAGQWSADTCCGARVNTSGKITVFGKNNRTVGWRIVHF